MKAINQNQINTTGTDIMVLKPKTRLKIEDQPITLDPPNPKDRPLLIGASQQQHDAILSGKCTVAKLISTKCVYDVCFSDEFR